MSGIPERVHQAGFLGWVEGDDSMDSLRNGHLSAAVEALTVLREKIAEKPVLSSRASVLDEIDQLHALLAFARYDPD